MNMQKFFENYYGTLKKNVDENIKKTTLFLILIGKGLNNYPNYKNLEFD